MMCRQRVAAQFHAPRPFKRQPPLPDDVWPHRYGLAFDGPEGPPPMVLFWTGISDVVFWIDLFLQFFMGYVDDWGKPR